MDNNTVKGNPYVGPRPFQREEMDRFFGREREARDLLSLVMSERLTLFYAQSGAGKTSLINARLIPGLEARGFETLPVGRVSGDLPPGVQTDNIFALNLMLKVDTGEDDPARFQGMRLAQFLGELGSGGALAGPGASQPEPPAAAPPIGSAAGEPAADAPAAEASAAGAAPQEEFTIPPRALIIDQFEELFNTHPEAWQKREDFLVQIVEAMEEDPYLWVVLAMREDYIAGLDRYAGLLPGGLRARYSMQRLGEAAALEAVIQPTAKLRPFERDAALNLVSNLSRISAGRDANGAPQFVPGEYVEPVQLQVVCYQLWEALKNQPGERITQGDIDRLARGRSLAEFVNRALADFYSDAVRRVANAPDVGVSEPRLREWFATQAITEARTRGFVFMGEHATGGIPNAAVKLLEGQLLRGENRAGGRWYELVHDRFIEPILQSNREWALERSRIPRLAAMIGVALLAVVAVGFAIWASAATMAAQTNSAQSRLAAETAMAAQARSTQAAETARAANANAYLSESMAQTADAQRRYGLAEATSTIQALAVGSTAQAIQAQLLALQSGVQPTEIAPPVATPTAYISLATPTAYVLFATPSPTAAVGAVDETPTATPEPTRTAAGVNETPAAGGETPQLVATDTPAPATEAATVTPSPVFVRPEGTAQMLQMQLDGLYATQTAIAAPAKRITIGLSVKNAPIEVTQLGNGPLSIVLVGGLHAGFAPSTIELAHELIAYFREHLDEIPVGVSLHIVENANPDATLNPGQTEGRLNANGVDLNRNWGCEWSATSTFRNRTISGGTAPFSEPETQALRDYLTRIQPAAVVVWTARATNGLISPGGCGERSQVSTSLAYTYGSASRYPVEPFSAYAVNGDITNWLDRQGVPAIFVTIKSYEQPDVPANLRAVQVLFDLYGKR